MLGMTASSAGARQPSTVRKVPEGFAGRLEAVWPAVLERCMELAGGRERVTRDAFVQALREVLPELSDEEDTYARQMALAVIQQVRGSNAFFEDLSYLLAALTQGRVPPEEAALPRATLTQSLFATQTTYGTKTLDLFKTTGVVWKIPKGFLNKYNRSNQEVLRRAAELAGAGPRHGAREVVAGVWGRVDVPTFLEACSQVLGELSEEEAQYVGALAAEQVPAGSPFIRDLPYLDKCLQQGRTPTAIKGPELLPTIFLNDTTSGLTDGLTLRHTGGRIR